jgi:CIC family chloride channel protein
VAEDPRGSEQPNVPPRGGDYPLRFWLAVVATGVAAGVGAMVMMAILHSVQHLAFGYHTGEYSAAAGRAGDLRLLAVLAGGGLVAGIGWWYLRTRAGGTGGEPTGAVWKGTGALDLPRTVVSGALSEVVIGMGGSLGREAAPQHTGAAFGSWVGRRLGLSQEQVVLLVACGAGAGVGAVYNVPLAGALFATELYLGSISLRTLVPAVATSGVATVVGWLTLPRQPVYHVAALGFPDLSLVVFALLAGPVVGSAAALYVKLVGWASDHRPKGRLLLVEPLAAFVVLGVAALRYPLLLGNGRDLAQFVFSGHGPALMLLALVALKPVVTSLCLRSGASGGLFTPTFSFGAVLGALLGQLWTLLWPGPATAAYPVVGAAAMLAAGMQAPAAALVFTVELTDTVSKSIVALLLASVGAVLMSRRIEIRSIYSARGARPSR